MTGEIRLVLLLLAVALTFSLMTYLFQRFFSNQGYMKAIPGLIALLTAGYYYYQAGKATQGFQDLAMFLMAIIFLAGFLGSLVTGLILEYLRRSRKKQDT